MKAIPQPTIERLIIYNRFLEKIIKYNKNNYISSLEMGDKLGISPVIIRKDLSFCQKNGCKGVGYEVFALKKSIEDILGINNTRPVILVGAGNFGRALINHQPFKKLGIDIIAAFDCDLNKIGNFVSGVKVQSINKVEKIIKKKISKLQF